MKLAWLCYEHEGDAVPVFSTVEPPSWRYDKIVPIVYAEIKQ